MQISKKRPTLVLNTHPLNNRLFSWSKTGLRDDYLLSEAQLDVLTQNKLCLANRIEREDTIDVIISQRDVIVKSISKRDSSIFQNIIHEVNALKTFTHPNILNLVDIYEDDVFVYLITDYCSHGDLANLIINKGKLPEQSIKSTIKQILQAVQYIHNLGFIHQDLKPDNIFIEDRNGKQNHIVVGDFGSCIPLDDITRYRTGTFQYIAPELKQGRLPSFASDAWSIGIILHTCIFGVYPGYQDPEQTEIDWNHEMYTQMPLEIKNVLQGLLQNDSEQRLTCTEALEMPFFKGTPTPKKLGCCRIS